MRSSLYLGVQTVRLYRSNPLRRVTHQERRRRQIWPDRGVGWHAYLVRTGDLGDRTERQRDASSIAREDASFPLWSRPGVADSDRQMPSVIHEASDAVERG